MPTNITDVDTFTDPIVIPADSDPADRTYVVTLAQGLANRTRNLDGRVEDVEDRIVLDEWTYPTAKSRTLEILPSAFEFSGITTADGVPWVFNSSDGVSRTVKTAGTNRSQVTAQLNRLVPANALVTEVYLLVKPGAARGSSSRIAAAIRTRQTVYTPGSESAPAPSLAYSVEDDGTTDLQSIPLTGGGGIDMTLGYTIWLDVVSGIGDTSDDEFYGVLVAFQDDGPINV